MPWKHASDDDMELKAGRLPSLTPSCDGIEGRAIGAIGEIEYRHCRNEQLQGA
jgi:hypothetical protein